MCPNRFYLIIFITCTQVVRFLKADGVIETNFVKFRNLEGKRFDGKCCDSGGWWSSDTDDCSNDCDHNFIICMGNNSKSSSMSNCEFGRQETGAVGGNRIRFDDNIGVAPNPLKIPFKKWSGLVKLKIDVIDVDDDDEYDFVDHIEYQYSTRNLRREIDTAPKSLILSGSRSRFDLKLKVFCDAGFYGSDCSVFCQETDDDTGHYNCDPATGTKICKLGWEGTACLRNIDDCASHRCYYGSTCVDGINSYSCLCPPGRTGFTCEAEINECASSPCQNGGHCQDAANSFICQCSPGFVGSLCEINFDECVSGPCRNGGLCEDGINSVMCLCQVGFEGDFCEVDVDECDPNPCIEATNCTDLVGDYRCNCLPGFSGKNCDYNINECASSPCQNNGWCIDEVNSYKCVCKYGYTGRHCEESINFCERDYCQNGATCHSQSDGFICECPHGFNGTWCELDIDECDPDPCGRGRCINTFGGFICECEIGYGGSLCKDEINECLEEGNPCYNSGTCVDLIGTYDCLCIEGYTGTLCQTDINECEGVTCENGGVCIDMVNDFRCDCPENFTGVLCESDESLMTNDKQLTHFSKITDSFINQTSIGEGFSSGTTESHTIKPNISLSSKYTTRATIVTTSPLEKSTASITFSSPLPTQSTVSKTVKLSDAPEQIFSINTTKHNIPVIHSSSPTTESHTFTQITYTKSDESKTFTVASEKVPKDAFVSEQYKVLLNKNITEVPSVITSTKLHSQYISSTSSSTNATILKSDTEISDILQTTESTTSPDNKTLQSISSIGPFVTEEPHKDHIFTSDKELGSGEEYIQLLDTATLKTDDGVSLKNYSFISGSGVTAVTDDKYDISSSGDEIFKIKDVTDNEVSSGEEAIFLDVPDENISSGDSFTSSGDAILVTAVGSNFTVSTKKPVSGESMSFISTQSTDAESFSDAAIIPSDDMVSNGDIAQLTNETITILSGDGFAQFEDSSGDAAISLEASGMSFISTQITEAESYSDVTIIPSDDMVSSGDIAQVTNETITIISGDGFAQFEDLSSGDSFSSSGDAVLVTAVESKITVSTEKPVSGKSMPLISSQFTEAESLSGATIIPSDDIVSSGDIAQVTNETITIISGDGFAQFEDSSEEAAISIEASDESVSSGDSFTSSGDAVLVTTVGSNISVSTDEQVSDVSMLLISTQITEAESYSVATIIPPDDKVSSGEIAQVTNETITIISGDDFDELEDSTGEAAIFLDESDESVSSGDSFTSSGGAGILTAVGSNVTISTEEPISGESMSFISTQSTEVESFSDASVMPSDDIVSSGDITQVTKEPFTVISGDDFAQFEDSSGEVAIFKDVSDESVSSSDSFASSGDAILVTALGSNVIISTEKPVSGESMSLITTQITEAKSFSTASIISSDDIVSSGEIAQVTNETITIISGDDLVQFEDSSGDIYQTSEEGLIRSSGDSILALEDEKDIYSGEMVLDRLTDHQPSSGDEMTKDLIHSRGDVATTIKIPESAAEVIYKPRKDKLIHSKDPTHSVLQHIPMSTSGYKAISSSLAPSEDEYLSSGDFVEEIKDKRVGAVGDLISDVTETSKSLSSSDSDIVSSYENDISSGDLIFQVIKTTPDTELTLVLPHEKDTFVSSGEELVDIEEIEQEEFIKYQSFSKTPPYFASSTTDSKLTSYLKHAEKSDKLLSSGDLPPKETAFATEYDSSGGDSVSSGEFLLAHTVPWETFFHEDSMLSSEESLFRDKIFSSGDASTADIFPGDTTVSSVDIWHTVTMVPTSPDRKLVSSAEDTAILSGDISQDATIVSSGDIFPLTTVSSENILPDATTVSSEDILTGDSTVSSNDLIMVSVLSTDILPADTMVMTGDIILKDRTVSSRDILQEDTMVSSGDILPEYTTGSSRVPDDTKVLAGDRLHDDTMISSGDNLQDDTKVSSGDILHVGTMVSSGDRLPGDTMVSSGDILHDLIMVSSGDVLPETVSTENILPEDALVSSGDILPQYTTSSSRHSLHDVTEDSSGYRLPDDTMISSEDNLLGDKTVSSEDILPEDTMDSSGDIPPDEMVSTGDIAFANTMESSTKSFPVDRTVLEVDSLPDDTTDSPAERSSVGELSSFEGLFPSPEDATIQYRDILPEETIISSGDSFKLVLPGDSTTDNKRTLSTDILDKYTFVSSGDGLLKTTIAASRDRDVPLEGKMGSSEVPTCHISPDGKTVSLDDTVRDEIELSSGDEMPHQEREEQAWVEKNGTVTGDSQMPIINFTEYNITSITNGSILSGDLKFEIPFNETTAAITPTGESPRPNDTVDVLQSQTQRSNITSSKNLLTSSADIMTTEQSTLRLLPEMTIRTETQTKFFTTSCGDTTDIGRPVNPWLLASRHLRKIKCRNQTTRKPIETTSSQLLSDMQTDLASTESAFTHEDRNVTQMPKQITKRTDILSQSLYTTQYGVEKNKEFTYDNAIQTDESVTEAKLETETVANQTLSSVEAITSAAEHSSSIQYTSNVGLKVFSILPKSSGFPQTLFSSTKPPTIGSEQYSTVSHMITFPNISGTKEMSFESTRKMKDKQTTTKQSLLDIESSGILASQTATDISVSESAKEHAPTTTEQQIDNATEYTLKYSNITEYQADASTEMLPSQQPHKLMPPTPPYFSFDIFTTIHSPSKSITQEEPLLNTTSATLPAVIKDTTKLLANKTSLSSILKGTFSVSPTVNVKSATKDTIQPSVLNISSTVFCKQEIIWNRLKVCLKVEETSKLTDQPVMADLIFSRGALSNESISTQPLLTSTTVTGLTINASTFQTSIAINQTSDKTPTTSMPLPVTKQTSVRFDDTVLTTFHQLSESSTKTSDLSCYKIEYLGRFRICFPRPRTSVSVNKTQPNWLSATDYYKSLLPSNTLTTTLTASSYNTNIMSSQPPETASASTSMQSFTSESTNVAKPTKTDTAIHTLTPFLTKTPASTLTSTKHSTLTSTTRSISTSGSVIFSKSPTPFTRSENFTITSGETLAPFSSAQTSTAQTQTSAASFSTSTATANSTQISRTIAAFTKSSLSRSTSSFNTSTLTPLILTSNYTTASMFTKPSTQPIISVLTTISPVTSIPTSTNPSTYSPMFTFFPISNMTSAAKSISSTTPFMPLSSNSKPTSTFAPAKSFTSSTTSAQISTTETFKSPSAMNTMTTLKSNYTTASLITQPSTQLSTSLPTTTSPSSSTPTSTSPSTYAPMLSHFPTFKTTPIEKSVPVFMTSSSASTSSTLTSKITAASTPISTTVAASTHMPTTVITAPSLPRSLTPTLTASAPTSTIFTNITSLPPVSINIHTKIKPKPTTLETTPSYNSTPSITQSTTSSSLKPKQGLALLIKVLTKNISMTQSTIPSSYPTSSTEYFLPSTTRKLSAIRHIIDLTSNNTFPNPRKEISEYIRNETIVKKKATLTFKLIKVTVIRTVSTAVQTGRRVVLQSYHRVKDIATKLTVTTYNRAKQLLKQALHRVEALWQYCKTGINHFIVKPLLNARVFVKHRFEKTYARLGEIFERGKQILNTTVDTVKKETTTYFEDLASYYSGVYRQYTSEVKDIFDSLKIPDNS